MQGSKLIASCAYHSGGLPGGYPSRTDDTILMSGRRAAALAICYCITRRFFPATCTDVEGLDTAMRLELKLGVISFIVGAVIHSLLAFRAFIQIGKPRIGS